MFFQLADLEGQTHHLVVLGHRALGELGAQIACKLAVVELADHDFLVAAQYVAGVLRQRADVVEMSVGHLLAFVVHLLDGKGQCAAGATPAHNEQVGVFGARHLLVGDVVGHAVHLLLTVVDHQLVVLRVGAQRTVGALLEAADAVAQAFHTGQSPFASEGLGVAAERTVVGIVRLGQTRLDFRQVGHFGDAEQLRAVAQIAVGEQDDGSHMLEGQFGGGVGPVEAVGAAAGGHDDKRSLAVAAIESLSQVALLGLGGQTRRGTAALHVDDDERQLGHHGQTQGLALQRQAGTRRRGASQCTGIRGTDGGADTCNLVLGLEHAGAQRFMLGQLDHHVRSRGDRIAAQEQAAATALAGSQKAPGGGDVARDVAIAALRHLGLGDADNLRVDKLQFLSIFKTLAEDCLVQLDHIGLLGELALQVGESLLQRLVGQEENHTQRKHIAALLGGFLVGTLLLANLGGEARNRRTHNGIGAFQLVGERILLIAGLFEGVLSESVHIDDDRSTLLGPFQLRLEGSGVHSDEDVALVARAVDVRANVNLIAADAGNSVVRSADFGGIVWESGDIVARKGTGVGEQRTGQLHTVARVTSKSDNKVILINNLIL